MSQVRFFFGELSGLSISPSDTPDQAGLVDGDLLVGQEVFEEDEEEEDDDDDDSDEIHGTESRFPAGNCRQKWECTFAHLVSELHPLARGQGP